MCRKRYKPEDACWCGIQFTLNLLISGYSDRHINGLILKYTAKMFHDKAVYSICILYGMQLPLVVILSILFIWLKNITMK